MGGMKKLSKKSPENEQEEKQLLEKWLELDRQFHELIFCAGGNRRSQQFIGKLNVQWHRLKIGLIAIEGRINKAIIEHQVIGNAIIDKDHENARITMSNHLENLKKVILRLMDAFNYSSS
jgi:DNA-binding GntR family transcriptional regulator